MALRQAASRVARVLHNQQQSRSFLDKLPKKAKEALDKTKSAAEELQKSAGGASAERLQQLREQAATATSTLAEQVQQAASNAQQLAKETVEELKRQNAAGGTAGGASAGGPQQSAGTGGAAGGAVAGSADAGSTAGAAAGEEQQQGGAEGSSGAGQQQAEGSAASRGFSERLRGFARVAAQEIARVVQSEQPSASALRGASAKAGDVQVAGTDALAISKQQSSGWQRQFEEMADKLGGHPFFARMRSLNLAANPVFEKGREAAERVRERWETSDSPLVHRIQDAVDSLQTESEQARALREIRARDPAFDMVTFLRSLRTDVQTVIKAYLESNEDVIHEHCSPEMIERLTGIMRQQKQQGLVPDPTLLDTSEVELVDLKMFEEEPVVVTQFTCQQINCTRDAFGNVVDGRPDEVHRVYYYWALQQEKQGYVGADGAYHPPRWQLREMLIRGMHHLL